jgi:thiosulfate dehydrogenase (quinone) large subunit
MKRNSSLQAYSGFQIFSLTVMQVLIGWHFLFEGLSKLFANPGWSAKSYLMGSVGPFSTIFHKMAESVPVLRFVDLANVWGLILIGAGLFAGLFSQTAKICGIALLLLYYMAYPPFVSLITNIPVEGSYWIVNKTLIEMAALFVLFLFPVSHISGLDRFIRSGSETLKQEEGVKD